MPNCRLATPWSARTPDEYLIYLPDGAAEVESGDGQISCASACVVIAPPGPSRVIMTAPGRVLRVFSAAAADPAALAHNAETR